MANKKKKAAPSYSPSQKGADRLNLFRLYSAGLLLCCVALVHAQPPAIVVDPTIIDPLVDTLTNSPSTDSRRGAADALAKIGSPAKRAVPALISALDDTSSRVRYASV